MSNLWRQIPKWWNQMICLPCCCYLRLTISQASTVQMALCFQQNWIWRIQWMCGSAKRSFSTRSKIGLLLWVEFRDIVFSIVDIFTHSVAAETVRTATETVRTATETVFVLLVNTLSSWAFTKFLRFLCYRSSSAFLPSITSFRSWTED